MRLCVFKYLVTYTCYSYVEKKRIWHNKVNNELDLL